eukprot:COSAG06_NODE_3981_length_4692_cov_1.721750_4_plen_84_part_00
MGCIHRCLVDDRIQFASEGLWGRGTYFVEEAACPSAYLPFCLPASATDSLVSLAVAMTPRVCLCMVIMAVGAREDLDTESAGE